MSSQPSIFDLTGKVACVTGASAGIGLHVASVLVAHGVKVIGIARRPKEPHQITDSLSANYAYIAADLSDQYRLDELYNSVAKIFGAPDILVNAAGINTREAANEVTHDGWQKTINLNLSAPFFLAQSFSTGMIQKGWGRIVNVVSLQSFRALRGGIAYGASKGGLRR